MASSTFNPSKEHRKGDQHLENAKEAGGQAWDKAKEAGTEAIDAAKQAGTDALAKVKDAGAATLEKAKDTVASAGTMASEAVSAAGQKADDVTAAAGHGIKTMGESMAKKTPHDGMMGHAAQAVADTIKGAGDYVEEHKLSGMAKDLEQVIKNHPVPALLVCFGIGICVGRALKD